MIRGPVSDPFAGSSGLITTLGGVLLSELCIDTIVHEIIRMAQAPKIMSHIINVLYFSF